LHEIQLETFVRTLKPDLTELAAAGLAADALDLTLAFGIFSGATETAALDALTLEGFTAAILEVMSFDSR
jgi:hypothetical protein